MDNVPAGAGDVNLAAAIKSIPAHIRHRPGAKLKDGTRQQIPYLPWGSVAELLDSAFGIGGWSVNTAIVWPPAPSNFPPLVACTIAAAGANRTAHARVISVKKADGSLMQPITDVEQLGDETRWTTGSDPFEVAERAAFVRCATWFGIRVPDNAPAQSERPAAQPAAQNRPAQAPPQRDGEQQTQAPPRGEQPSGALEGEPTEFRINGVLWKRTKSGDGYLADVDAAQYGGATRLLLKKGKDGKGYGACCFDGEGPMKSIGWHNGATAKEAIAGLEAALGFVPF